MASPAMDSTSFRRESGVVSPSRPGRSRTHSISSDRPSTISHSLMSPPSSISPQAAFIAASAASQIVTNDHDSHADTWYDQHGIEPAGETALVTPAALTLVNSFLDQLLFNFLQVSKATTLAALRPAVSEVLKPKLAKDAVNNADEELREYLGGADEDEYLQPQSGDGKQDWDLELVWKRTRLRCMVYSSLGDMEEEDEDLHMEQENLEIGADEHISDVISPAVAIFLTSVLEYMGELTLTVAGQAAYHRMRNKFEKDLKEGLRTRADTADRIVVEELDMERVALDRTLGRLWRGWKKRIRTPTIESIAGQLSMRSLNRHYRSDSQESAAFRSTAADSRDDLRRSQDYRDKTIAEDVQPADIALPMRDTDVDEIEVPGLVSYSDEEEEIDESIPEPKRSKSLSLTASVLTTLPDALEPRPQPSRKRSGSHPEGRFNPFHLRVEQRVLTEEARAAESRDVVPVNNGHLAVALDENGVSPMEEDSPPAPANDPGAIGLAMTSDTASPNEPSASPGDFDSADEDVEYEEAEIVTSARVSMTGSSSPSEPDKLERTSSVRSARIVSVSAPKASSSSRPTSVEASQLSSLSSLNAISGKGSPAVPEQPSDAPNSRTVSPGTMRSAAERSRSAAQNPTISESDEEADFFPSELQGVPARASPAARNPYSQPSRAYPMGMQEATPGTKVTIIGGTTTSASFEPIPEVPAKAPGHAGKHRPKEDSSDNFAARTSEETVTYASQNNGNAPRPTHASASSVSSNTGRLKAVRTSEEHYSRKAENVARNFEDLIHSNQTITYTLTPENMRDSKSTEGSPILKYQRRSEESRVQAPPGSIPVATSETKLHSGAHRGPGSGQAGHESSTDRATATVSRSSSRQDSRSPRMSGSAQAREARVQPDTTADFAEFIKSTGPPGENRPLPLKTSASGGASSMVKNSSESRRVSTNSNRGRYQPREAAVDKGDNSDLIDFIRQGPPASGPNTHRIPRHVAPFRNTMDSDQMAGANGGRAVDANIPEIRHSRASTNVTENSMPSMQSSVNSSSALLKKNNSSSMQSRMFDEDDMMPKRKQRRVRDPYAIDFSDEEDEDDELFATTPKPPPKQEESLADFLRNYRPPSPPPIPPTTQQKIPKKKMSAPSLMARFRNTYNRDSHSSASPAKPVSVSEASSSSNGRTNVKGGHVPIQISMPNAYDSYGAVGNIGPPRRRSTAGASGKVPRQRFEPREAVSVNTRTSDLAAFLRDSSPPSSNAGLAANQPTSEESHGISKMRKRLGLA